MEEELQNLENQPKPEKPKNNLTRREFLRATFLGSAGLAFQWPEFRLFGFDLFDPQFWRLLKRSVEKGEVLEDIRNTVKTNLVKEIRYEAIGLIPAEYSEPWMDSCFSNVEIFSTEILDGYVGIFELDEVELVTRQEIDEPLHKTMEREGDFFFLPIPPIHGFHYYLYHQFRLDGDLQTNPGAEKSPFRGGVVLENRNLKVLSPEEIAALNLENEEIEAVMEYPYFLSCEATNESKKSALDELESWGNTVQQNGTRINEYDLYSSLLVSFYSTDDAQQPKTCLLGTLISPEDYAKIKIEQRQSGDPAQILQGANVFTTMRNLFLMAHGYLMKNNEGYTKMNIVFPDPNLDFSGVTPEKHKLHQIKADPLMKQFLEWDEVDERETEYAYKNNIPWFRRIFGTPVYKPYTYPHYPESFLVAKSGE